MLSWTLLLAVMGSCCADVSVGFDKSVYTVGEGNSSVTVCARLTGSEIGQPITVVVNPTTRFSQRDLANPGPDYISLRQNLTFDPEDRLVPRCANITIMEDSIFEGTESFSVSLLRTDSSLGITLARPHARVEIIDNDVVHVSLEQTEFTVHEVSSTIQICANLTGEFERSVQLMVTPTPGTARAGFNFDFTGGSRPITFFASDAVQHKCAIIPLYNDFALEQKIENFTVHLTSTNPSIIVTQDLATVNIIDNDVGLVSFISASYRVRETSSGSTLWVCVELTGGLEIPLSVTVSTQNNTALAGFDYVPMTTEVTFPLHDETSVTECRMVEVRDDIIVEGEETFFLVLSSQNDRVKLERNRTEITIVDNDVVNVNFVSMSYSVGEGEGDVEVCARMVGLNVKDVVVTLSTNDGTAKSGREYVANSFRLVFPSDSVSINSYLLNRNTLPESVKCANVTIVDDNIVERSTFKTFTMHLTSADSTVKFITPRIASVNIFDNDVAVVSLDPTEYTVMENMTSVRVCAVLQGEAELEITASLRTTDGTARAGSDYTALRSMVRFLPRRTDPQCVSVPVTDDNVLEDVLQTFHVGLTVVTSDDRVSLGQRNTATVTIRDNDIGLVSFTSASYRVRETSSGSTQEVCVELTGGLEIPLSVTVSTQNNTALAGFDYVPTTIEVAFPFHDESSVTECRTVEVRDDIILEGEETFFLVLSSKSNRTRLERNRTEITILDNDVVNVNFVSMSYSVGEGEGDVEVCARMVGLNAIDVVVTMSTNDGTAKSGTEYVADTFQLVFPSDPASISRYLRNSSTVSLPETVKCGNITILDDNILEQSTFKTFTMHLTSADSTVKFITPNTTSVNIFDNDVAVVSLDPTEYTITENMTSVNVCAVLQGQADFRIAASLHTVDGTARAGSDYTLSHSRVHFVPRRTAPQCVSVPVTDDDVLEDVLQTFHVGLTVVTSDDRVLLGQRNMATVTIRDNDRVEVGITKSSYTILEGEGVAEVCAELTGLIERSVAVNISTVTNGQAEADVDYDEMSTTLVYESSISAEQLLCMEILIQNDTILENTESFDVVISTIDPGVNLTRLRVPVYIQDDDGVRVSIEHREYSIQEGEGSLTVCTTLDGAIERNVQLVLLMVPNTAQAGTDFVDTTALLTYESEAEMQCAEFEILDDDIYESVETFTLALNITQQAVGIHIGDSTVSIHDNDHVNISFQSAAYSVVEGEGSVGVCMDLRGRTERNVPILVRTTSLTAQGGKDYEDDPIRTHFPPSLSMNQTLCLDIPIERDAILEHPEEFRAHLSSRAHRVTVTRGSAVVFITDDDNVTVEFGAAEYNVSEDTETEVELCVMLKGTLERQVLVNVATVTEIGTATADDDFIPVALNFTFDSTVGSHCFNVSINDDLLVEGSEEFFVSLSTADPSVSLVPLTTVIITDEDVLCPASRTVSLRGNYDWEERPPNREIELPCQFGEALPGGMVRRFCGPGGRWEDPTLEECYADADALFDAIFNAPFSKENLRQLNLVVDQVTKTGDAKAEYVKVIAWLLEEFAKLVADDDIIVDTERLSLASDKRWSEMAWVRDYLKSFTHVLEIMNNIQKWDSRILQQQSSSIVRSVEAISVGLVKRESFTDLAHHGDDLAFVAENVDIEELQLFGTDRSFRDDGNGTLNVTTESANINRTLDEDQVGHISLPRSLFDRINKTNVGLVFSQYKTPVLFPLTNDSKNVSEIVSSVVAASVAGENITNLSEPITILLQLDPELAVANYSDVRCVSWDFNAANNTGNWTSKGCKTESVKDDVVNCSCTHLTNFACLVDIRSRVDGEGPSEEVRFALGLLSIIGVVLSLIGITLTIITLLVFKKLRERDSTKFHVQLCLSMALMMLTFVAGIDRTEIFYVCIVISSLIHYFTLVTVMWMAAEALLMFEKLIIVFTKCTTKYLVLISLICWLLPIPAVVIPPAINTNFTIGSDPEFCFISHTYVFFGAFLGPIFLVLVFNIVIFILVLNVIIRHTQKKFKESRSANKRKGTLRMMLSLCGVMVLFGFSWALAAFTVKGASEVFQFLFVVFNSLQGFFIFLFFVVLAKEARELWLRLCGCKKRKKYHVTSTAYSSVISRSLKSKKSTTSFDSVPELLDIDDKTDVEASQTIALQRPTTHCAVGFSAIQEEQQQPDDQQTQPETEDDGHSTTDSGITTDRKTESDSSPASIKKIDEVDTPEFVTYGEACSSEALHNIDTGADTAADHTETADYTAAVADHTDTGADHNDTASDHTETADHTDTVADHSAAADHTDTGADYSNTAADHTDTADHNSSHDPESPLPAMSTEDSSGQGQDPVIVTQTLDAASDAASHQAEDFPQEDGGETVVVVVD